MNWSMMKRYIYCKLTEFDYGMCFENVRGKEAQIRI